MSEVALFNSNYLNTVTGLTVLAFNPYRPPRRDLTIAELTHIDNSKVNSAFYREREIMVRVGIARATRNLLEKSLDQLWVMLHGIEKELILNQSQNSSGQDSTRKYYCTFREAIVSRDGGSYIEIELYFACSDPFGYDTVDTTLLELNGSTLATRSDVISVSGSARYQVPVITITYTTVTGATNKAVSVGNPTTTQVVSVDRTWANGDVLEIDSFNKTVKVNGVDVEFTGAIPEWEPGSGFWYYADTFTTRSMRAHLTYKKRWL